MEGCLGEESFQMWELNRRLEAYLARVKALEEQNELLSAELGGLRAQSRDCSWRTRADNELAALRALVDQRWQEKHAAEVARDNLVEEVAGVAGRCQQQRLARERMAEEVARSRRAVEAEKCAQVWLSNQAAELERELEALRAEHEEERAGLNAQVTCAPRGPAPPRACPAPAPEVEELARRLGEAWRGAVRGYQERVAHLETSLGQSCERLGQAVQGAREGRLELQQLQVERGGLQERRAALEQRLESRWQERLQATEKFQLTVEALEQEKQGLQSQIAQILEGRQQLAHLKMSLSLEVATYRTLLEAENSRLQTPGSSSKASLGIQDPKMELHFPGTPEGRRLGPLLSVLSPAALSPPLPDTLETPMPAFLKSQGFLQARIPTLASTPIPPTPQAPCPATDAETRAQDAPLSLLQPQAGRQQAPEAMWAEAKVATPASILPEPGDPGTNQQEASTGQSPEDHASLAPPLSPDHPSLEAKLSGSVVSSRFQEEGEGQICKLAENDKATEIKAVSSLQQETWQKEGDLVTKELQDSQGSLEKETSKSLKEEIQDPLMSLEKQSQETQRSVEENQESVSFLEEENLETLKSLNKENLELLKSLEEKDIEIARPVEKETVELRKPIGKEDPQPLQSPEKENQQLMRSLEGNVEICLYPEKENNNLVSSLEEDFESLSSRKGALEKDDQNALRPEVENQDTSIPIAKENHESLMSLKDENQETLRPPQKENQEPLRSLEEEKQETWGLLEEETQQPLRSLEEEQITQRPEPLESLEKYQEMFRPPEKENQELRFPKEESVEEVRSLETENLEPLKAVEEYPEMLTSLETQEPVWSGEGMNERKIKPLEKETQEPLRSVEENQETLRPLEKQDQDSLRSLGEWNLENLRSPEDLDKGSQEYLGEEGKLEMEENQELLRSMEEEGQDLPLSASRQRWENVVVGDQEQDQEIPPGEVGVDHEDEAELALRELDGFAGKEAFLEQGEEPMTATGEAWNTDEHPGNQGPKDWVPGKGASEEEGAKGSQDLEEQVGALDLSVPLGMSEVMGLVLEDEDRDAALGGGMDSPQVTLGSETAMGESAAVGTEQGQEQGAGGLEGTDQLVREEVMEPPLGEEGLEAKSEEDLKGPRKALEEAVALEPEVSPFSRVWEELEPESPWRAEAVFSAETFCQEGCDAPQPRPLGPEETEADEQPGTQSTSPRCEEPWSPTPIPEDALELQPLAEGSQEASWGLGGRAEALAKVEDEQEELGCGEGPCPEDLQDKVGESREESEAEVDELGETLPDSTPLGLYLSSPTSLRWGLAGVQRPSPQGEAGKEGWDPAGLTSGDLGEEEEEEEDGADGEKGAEEAEGGRDSDLSEEFEELATEATLLPGVPREVVGPLGLAPQPPLEPAAWDGDGESDGFADEEESAEEGEEEARREPGAGWWGPESSVGDHLQRGALPLSEAVEVSVPGDEGLRGAVANLPVTVLESESQDSTDPSGSGEESGATPSEGKDRAPGPLEPLSGVEDLGLEGGDALSVNGQGPSLKEELEHVNGGVVNGLEQSEGVGQGKLGSPECDRGSPLEEEEGSALKTPWAGAPLHLGPGQFLRFTQQEGDGDSWSSGED
ncbi:nestin [Talpa occidentalis]|uniref:nestin n=1 Tax=Talpa occidentalis TaxID=50954 RepID=UPI00188E9787|nr:nestin [Talpa occidentalis]